MMKITMKLLIELMHFHFRDGMHDNDEKLRDILIKLEEYTK
jgi:hypothetical protein